MYESTDALNTVLNSQGRKKKNLIRQNKHHTFLKMPQMRSGALAVQLSSRLKWLDVLQLLSVLYNRAAAIELSLEEINKRGMGAVL